MPAVAGKGSSGRSRRGAVITQIKIDREEGGLAMIRLTGHGVFLHEAHSSPEEGRRQTMAYRILQRHNHSGDPAMLKLRFDALVSPDNNYVNILQTVRAVGIERFPVPYVLSNCHHALCAVGGTINEDDHVYGLDCAGKYGGIFLPPHRGVLHQYMREAHAGCGKMILGSDSHTRYGALGTMGIGEGGGEIAKQLLGKTYDIPYPQVIAVRLTGAPRPGVGPMDVALALIAATFKNGFNKNKVLEFVGDGLANLSMEYRMGIDVMTTESAALSSIWQTDEKTLAYLASHGRQAAYAPLSPGEGAYYDGLIEINLSKVPCMIALPFHPSNAMPIEAFLADRETHIARIEAEGRSIKGADFSLRSHLKADGLVVDQALIGGCAGGLTENLAAVADILKGYCIPGNGLQLGVNPASMPVMQDLVRQGIASELMLAGVTLRPAICGPCFGVTDVPANGQLSIRHVTRNYANREGSNPGQGQMAAVCLMDARSIAATVRNGGRLTPATALNTQYREITPAFEQRIYEGQVFDRFGKTDESLEPRMGPNIADWPAMYPPSDHLLLHIAGSYADSVTTDELIPSGEASSFRSNPERISGYTLIHRDPMYLARAKAVRSQSQRLRANQHTGDAQLDAVIAALAARLHCRRDNITLGSAICADQIGDGSSREQAASCQKVLGGFANIARAYATRRYRANCINWGILPLRTAQTPCIPVGSLVLIRNIREALRSDARCVQLEILDAQGNTIRQMPAFFDHLTHEEAEILLAGCFINDYRNRLVFHPGLRFHGARGV